ncbi:unnamed protein product [Schistosoma rodhaini]|uniref:F-box domain-containing protein n=1 Tax=Schistosoma rodhaini TaxID=6188 RepID=A0AA85ERJ8_9TREM|nr:unnamed protein product [Schistosoma rodhaini]
MKRCADLVPGLCVPGGKQLRHRCSDLYSYICLSGISVLPFDIKCQILSLVEISDLINLWDVSKEFQLMIEKYCNSSQCPQLSQFYNPHNHELHSAFSSRCTVTLYKHAGNLFRRIYQYQPLCRKLQFLECSLRRHMPNLEKSSRTSQNLQEPDRYLSICSVGPLKCLALLLYGVFLKEFIFGWPEQNIQRVFHTLVHVCFNENFWFRLSSLICQRPGVDPQSELTLRLFLRKTFLDPNALPQMYDKISSPSSSVSNTKQFLSSDNSSLTIQYDALQNLHTVEAHSETSWTRETISYHVSPRYPSDNALLTSVSSSSSYSDNGFSSDDLLTVTQLPRGVAGYSLSTFPTLVKQNLSASSSKLTNTYFWPASNILMEILHSYSYTHQARILFILYGPLHRGNLMWRTMCENTAADSQQLSACFGELGSVLSNMFHSGLWTSDDIINIIDQITITPEDWLAENVACLLHTSGPEIALLAVTNKAHSGKTAEVAVTLTSLCLVQVKIRAKLTELINLVNATFQATKEKDRTAFLDQLARSFQDVIVDLYETDELEERVEDFSTILRAQAEFMRALMAYIYEE